MISVLSSYWAGGGYTGTSASRVEDEYMAVTSQYSIDEGHLQELLLTHSMLNFVHRLLGKFKTRIY